ncbi:MAG: 4Fe-4S binding protein, partial [Desulfofustis sp.]
ATQLRPQADPDKCSRCEACIEQCPVSALYMENDLPSVHEELCITCFCCQEICPEQAITLR